MFKITVVTEKKSALGYENTIIQSDDKPTIVESGSLIHVAATHQSMYFKAQDVRSIDIVEEKS